MFMKFENLLIFTRSTSCHM